MNATQRAQAVRPERAERRPPAGDAGRPGASGERVSPDSQPDLAKLLNVDEMEAVAKAKLPIGSYAYVASGAGAEVTMRANRTAFGRWVFRPRVLVNVKDRDLSTTVLGTKVSMPVLIAPYALQCLLDPEGEVATARAAGAAGTVMALSMGSTRTIEDVGAAATGPLWFQPYLFDDLGIVRDAVARAEAARYASICLTCDSPALGYREAQTRWPHQLPEGVGWANMPLEGGRPRWLSGASWTWETLDAVRRTTKLPIVLKGILTAEDAALAVEHGAAAIVVSNHGGRQLDGSIASLDALPEIVDAVGGRMEVLLDGGIRRGTDVLTALALGARAVLIGRAAAWGLAVAGQAGVERVLELLRDELSTSMAIVGARSLADVTREHVARTAA
ncbi:MAG: alpha-hydroxy-acid oxidizing protein [Chloroflexi bacterium]|nr:alpha-hydroxy-acid oxidizing protein [Chloroflexota bacterium]